MCLKVALERGRFGIRNRGEVEGEIIAASRKRIWRFGWSGEEGRSFLSEEKVALSVFSALSLRSRSAAAACT